MSECFANASWNCHIFFMTWYNIPILCVYKNYPFLRLNVYWQVASSQAESISNFRFCGRNPQLCMGVLSMYKIYRTCNAWGRCVWICSNCVHVYFICVYELYAKKCNMERAKNVKQNQMHSWKKCFCLREPVFRGRIFLIWRRNFPNME